MPEGTPFRFEGPVPPELLIDRDGPAAPLSVSFRALVLDPRGGPMSYDWRFCPVESNQTCGDFDQRRTSAPAEFQPVLDAARAQMQAGSIAIAPGTDSTDSAGVEAFAVVVDPGLFTYHLVNSGLGLGNGAWASAVLKLHAGAEDLQAQKRLVLNARDLSQWNLELAAAGWQVCPPPPAVALPGCADARVLPRTNWCSLVRRVCCRRPPEPRGGACLV